MHFGQSLLELIRQNRGEIECDFVGCTPDEISALMERQNVSSLPSTYREYLEVFGRNTCTVMFTGIDATYEYLLNMKRVAIELIGNFGDGSFKLPENAFVFAMIQGTDFWYFRTQPPDNNPSVFIYLEGEGGSKDIGDLVTFFSHLI